MKEILATGLNQVLSTKRIYLVDGWLITPWGQTLQSLGTIRRCRPLGDPMSNACIWIIEFSVNCLCDYILELCVYNMIVSIWHDLNINTYISLPFFCVFVLFVFLLRWSPIWWEQMWLVSEAPLENEEPSFRMVEGFCGSCCKWVVLLRIRIRF